MVGKPLAALYTLSVYLCRLFSKKTVRTIISSPEILEKQLCNGQKVSQHFQLVLMQHETSHSVVNQRINFTKTN